MSKNHRLDQYRSFFTQSVDLKGLGLPEEGWIRTLRKALGMSGPQLAAKLKLSKSQVSQMERMELEDRITLKQLRRVAESLNCDLIYGLMPRQSLEEMVHEQAKIKAAHIGEKDGLKVEKEIQRLQKKMPRNLWDPLDAEKQSAKKQPAKKLNTEEHLSEFMIGKKIPLSRYEINKLAQAFFVKRLILFGSAAKEELEANASIHMIVEFQPGLKSTMSSTNTLTKLSAALSKLLKDHKVELFTRSIMADPAKRRSIEKEMIELYIS